MSTLILFDLDGTLVDTAPEIADAVNQTLRELGRDEASLERVRGWIGQGTRALLHKALHHGAPHGVPIPPLDAVWTSFELAYAERCGTRSTLYPGVLRGLERLRQQGRRMAVVTNKESAFAHRVLVAHRLAPYFDLVIAGDTLPVRKPDPAVVAHALQALDVAPDEALLVGDSAIDVEVARRAGIAVWVVSYGYHHDALNGEHRPDRMIDSIETVAELPQRVAID